MPKTFPPVPHPVETRIITVVEADQRISEEQRERVGAWLRANGADPKAVAQNAITLECKAHAGKEWDHIIGFQEFYRDAEGRKVINAKTKNEALTFQRWVPQTVALEPDPAWADAKPMPEDAAVTE